MPAFTQHYLENLEPDGKFHPDEGGKKSVTGLYVYSGAKAKTFYVYLGRGKPKEKIGRFPAFTVERARIEAKRKLGEDAGGHDHQAARRHKKVLDATTLEAYLHGPFKTYAEANIAGHQKMIANIKTAFGHLFSKPMTDINDSVDMARWRKDRSKVSLATQRRDLTNLKAVLNHAVREKAIPHHQLTHYRLKGTLVEGAAAQNGKKVRYLTREEETRLRAALDARESKIRAERTTSNKWRAERGYSLKPEMGPNEYADHIKPLVLLALNTGLRRGDLFGLQWDHVDLERRQIRKVIEKTSHVKRKHGITPEPAVLPLSSEAVAILEQCKRQSASDYVFASPRSGGRLDNIKKAFEAVLKNAKISGFRFHDLRHTFASRLVMAGVDINTVRELMTHADIKMTLVYAHLSPDHKAAALDKAFGTAQ